MFSKSRLPLAFQGELHDIHLVNFSVDPLDLLARFGPLPKPLKPRLVNGRALISMVDVQLRNMRSTSRWIPFRFHYQHVAFRLLVEDDSFTDSPEHNGIYFLQSFTNRPMIETGGNLLTHFNFQTAQIQNFASGLRLNTGDKFIAYDIDGPLDKADQPAALTDTIARIDRAYAVESNEVWETRILREAWPLQAMHCNHFATNFFATARLEAVHKVVTPIDYIWLSPRKVTVAGTPEPRAAGSTASKHHPALT